MRQVSFRGVDECQLIAALYNCAYTGDENVFVTREEVEKYLIDKKEEQKVPGRLIIKTLKFGHVEKTLDISMFSNEHLISQLYEKFYGKGTVNKIMVVLNFFIKNRMTLGRKNEPSLYRETAKSTSDNEESKRYYQIRLQTDATELLCNTFSFIDITYISLNMLYTLVILLSCEIKELTTLFNKLNLALRDPQGLKRNMLLINPTEELQMKALELRKGLIKLLWEYKDSKERYEIKQTHTPSC